MAFAAVPIVPTARAVALLALAAPVAVVIAAAAPAAWPIAPLFALALIALVVLDARLAGRMEDIRITVPGDAEVGADTAMHVSGMAQGGRPAQVDAAVGADARLLPGGRGELALHAEGNAWRGALPFTPARRGTARVEEWWLRWTGPMGLGARQVRRTADLAVRVWPNIAAVRSPAMQTFLRNAEYGLIARRFRGEGTQFESLTEYQPGMDRKRIDWKASARHAQLYAKEYETERNNPIVFAFDCGQAMCEPVDGMPRIDRAVSAALQAAYVALRGGDKVALFGFAARPSVFTPFVSGTANFHRLQRGAADLDYAAQEPNFTLALATLANRLQRRSLIVLFSDFTDPTSAQLMIESIGRLTSRHLVLFVTMTDSELDAMSGDDPRDMETLAMAVTADALLRQRALVLRTLRQLGVDVIEAPYDRIGTRLIDAYLAIKRAGAIG